MGMFQFVTGLLGFNMIPKANIKAGFIWVPSHLKFLDNWFLNDYEYFEIIIKII